MARAKENLKIEIEQSQSEDKRVVKIIVSGVAKDFQLSDLLNERGVIESLDTMLKDAVKKAIDKYLTGIDDLLATITSQKSKTPSTEKPKTGNGKSKIEGAKNDPAIGMSRAPGSGIEV